MARGRVLLSQGEIEQRIEDMVDDLQDATEDYRDRIESAVKAEVDYKVAFAKAMLMADGKNAEMRSAAATVACERQLLDHKIEAALADAAKEKMRTLRDALSAHQSLLSSVRGQA